MDARKEITTGIGFFQQYSMGAISAGLSAKTAIAATDIDRIYWFNVVYVVNNSIVNVSCWLDGNSNRSLYVPAGSIISLNGSRFRELVIHNEDGATATGSSEVIVSVQKELGARERAELDGLNGAI